MLITMENPIEAIFQSLADTIGFPVDQVRYIVLLFLTYPVAYVFRHTLHPAHTSLTLRHAVSTLIGVAMGILCFGWQMAILAGILGVAYLLLWVIPPTHVQWVTMAWAMGCMGVAHYYRLVTDFGGFHLDFTGPLMLMVQKVTLVGFSLHDGVARQPSQLNDDQKKQKISVRPSLLEYFSYMLNFHQILAGPNCTLRDYLAFIDGSNLAPPQNPNAFAKAKEHSQEPSSMYPVLTKLGYALLAVTIHVAVPTNMDMVMDPANQTLPVWLLLANIEMFRIRNRYYFIWFLSESINNATGLGFQGYDKQGRADWGLITNMYVWDIELGQNYRSITSGWNAQTGLWLRRACYERVAWYPTLATFVLSAWWHGFYPGYYLSFVYFAIGVTAARKMRRLLRHHFLGSAPLKFVYDVGTFLVTHLFLDFGTFAFILMWPERVLAFWRVTYYIPLILVLVVAFTFPSGGGGGGGKGSSSGSKKQQPPQAVASNHHESSRPEESSSSTGSSVNHTETKTIKMD